MIYFALCVTNLFPFNITVVCYFLFLIDTANLLPSQQDYPLSENLTYTSPHPPLPQHQVFLNNHTDTENYKPVHKNAAVGAQRQAAFESAGERITSYVDNSEDDRIRPPDGSNIHSSKQSMVTATTDVLLFPYLLHSQKGDKPTLLKVCGSLCASKFDAVPKISYILVALTNILLSELCGGDQNMTTTNLT